MIKITEEEGRWATNSTIVQYLEVPDEPINFWIVAAAASVSGVALLSQIPIVLIGLGLEGDFSAKTLMVVQAVAEMLRRAAATYLALCGAIEKESCFAHISQLSCKISLYFIFVVMLVPDWLMMLVALDRVLAIERGVWYRIHCTVRSAWIPISAVILFLGIVGTPRIGFGELIPETPACRQVSYKLYVPMITILGIPALVLVAAMTARLIYNLSPVKRTTAPNLGRRATDPNSQRVNIALTLHCVIFTIFSLIQYAIFLVARSVVAI
ncbi:uncharacterized protein LOC134844950 [Symsagittifera roscoffensis]|uniref:uncharacterized protein LOC134844950 n=1 Tax=Symsagittifera roscoffensis TaxID=84072 RepID=UPI00307BEB25